MVMTRNYAYFISILLCDVFISTQDCCFCVVDFVCARFSFKSVMGDSRKYPYHTGHGWHRNLTPPLAFGNSKMLYPPPPPMPSEFHFRKPPLPFGNCSFFQTPLRNSLFDSLTQMREFFFFFRPQFS